EAEDRRSSRIHVLERSAANAGARAGVLRISTKLRALCAWSFFACQRVDRPAPHLREAPRTYQGVAMALKEASVAELTNKFESSTAVLLTEYRGLTVAELKELRDSIRQDAEYAVAKNTLTKLAAAKAGVEGLDDNLKGPSALAFVHGDPVAVAKGLRAFAKAHPLLVIKGGYFDGAPLSAEEVNKLADLESREVLLAKVAGMMKASMSKAAAVFQALPSKTVRTV